MVVERMQRVPRKAVECRAGSLAAFLSIGSLVGSLVGCTVGSSEADAGLPVVDGCIAGAAATYRDRPSGTTEPVLCPACPQPITGLEGDGGVARGPTLEVSGFAPGATSCDWFVLGGACGVSRGELGTDPDGTGAYNAVLPLFCGENVVQLACRNGSGVRVASRTVGAVECDTRDLLVTLAWDRAGENLDLHLVREGGRIHDGVNDCSSASACLGPRGLEWGDPARDSDNPRKDLDRTGRFGPESISLGYATSGRYHVLVEYAGNGEPATARAQIAVRESTVLDIVETPLAYHHVWLVATVDFPEGRVSIVDRVVDCTDRWGVDGAPGCALNLP